MGSVHRGFGGQRGQEAAREFVCVRWINQLGSASAIFSKNGERELKQFLHETIATVAIAPRSAYNGAMRTAQTQPTTTASATDRPAPARRTAKKNVVPLGLLLLSLPVTFLLLPQPGGGPALERIYATPDGLRSGEIRIQNNTLYAPQRINGQFCIVAKPMSGGRAAIIARLQNQATAVTRILFTETEAICVLRLVSRSNFTRTTGPRLAPPDTRYLGEFALSSAIKPNETREQVALQKRPEEPMLFWRIPLPDAAPLAGTDAAAEPNRQPSRQQRTVPVGDNGYAALDNTAITILGNRIFCMRPSFAPLSVVTGPQAYRYERRGELLQAYDLDSKANGGNRATAGGETPPFTSVSRAVFNSPIWSRNVLGWIAPRRYPDKQRDFRFLVGRPESAPAGNVKTLPNFNSELAPVACRSRLYWVEMAEGGRGGNLSSGFALSHLRLWSANADDGTDRRIEPMPRGRENPIFPLRLMLLRNKAYVLVGRERRSGLQFGYRNASMPRPIEYGLLPVGGGESDDPATVAAVPLEQIVWLPAPYQGQDCYLDNGFLYFVVPETRKSWMEMFSEATTAQMIDVLYRLPFPTEMGVDSTVDASHAQAKSRG